MAKLHIHAPQGVYLAQRKKYGDKRWQTIEGNHLSRKDALITLAMSMEGYKRGRVIFSAEYYDPNVVAEINQ